MTPLDAATLRVHPASNVPKGYKHTEVGMIPETWDVFSLGELLAFQNGVNADKQHYGRGIPFANVLEVITHTHLTAASIPGRVQLAAHHQEGYSVKSGDILFNRTSETQDEIGLASVYVGDEPIVFGGFVIRGRPVSDQLHRRYAGWGLRGPTVRDQIIARGQGAIRANIGQADLRTVIVPLPALAEQETIANALSDANALIEGLENLIAKKRAIKQGAMQELLMGKRRLPGFAGAWIPRRLADSAIVKARIGWQGLTTAEYLEMGQFYLVSGTEFHDGQIAWSECHYVDQRRFSQDPNIQLRPRDVLVTKDGTIGKVAYVSELSLSATLNSGVFVVRPRDEAFVPEYFSRVLQSEIFTDFLARLSAGSTINHLYQKDFVHFTFDCPPSSEEQTAIASILTDMDDEISTLDAKLAKARQVKQGMMQELLTGRIRLV